MSSTLKALLRRIATEQSSPARLGAAVALGIMIGVSPFFGFHLALCLGLATLLRLNRAVTYLAANISVPWIAPLLIYASLQLGHLARHGEPLALSRAALLADPWASAGDWLVGAPILGLLLGAPMGLLTWWAVRRLRRALPQPSPPPDPIQAAMDRVADRYRPQGRFVFGYIQGKLKHDPVYRQLAQRLPMPSPVVDLGCGRGQTLLLLSALDPTLEGIGIDWDPNKLRRALRADDRLRVEAGDLRHTPIPRAGTLLMIDVLHYHDAPSQRALLRRAVEALAPGGRLLIRDVDAAAGWRARVNILQERIGQAVGFNRGATLCFLPASEIIAALEGWGLRVTMMDCWGGTPLANVLIEARLEQSEEEARP
ncbi:DUF2062 domain-containing protein [Myxococcota bacterium]|nr:DUF2062 domain-containing protein [Myxococcota bacterium]